MALVDSSEKLEGRVLSAYQDFFGNNFYRSATAANLAV